jgi:diacylglycerol O-acyltransferase
MADQARGTSYRLTNQDASFLYQESAVTQMHGAAIFFLKGKLEFDKLFQHFQERLHVSPRFRQRLLFPPYNIAHPTLEDDPDFKLENHVQHRELSKRVSETEAINEILRFNNSRLLDRTRPLWCVTLFSGLAERSLILWEMHHAIVDGVSGFDLMNKTMDFTPRPARVEAPAEPWRPAKLPTPSEAYVRAIRDLMVEQIDTASRNARESMGDPMGAIQRAQSALDAFYRVMNENASTVAVATPWNSGAVTEERIAAWLKLPFAEFRAIRSAFGGTINDIVLTILGEGAARYLKHHGWPTEGKLRIGCPVNVRRPGEEIKLENRVSIMMPMTPAKPMNVVERLQSITAETKRIKDSGIPYAIEQMMSTNTVQPAILAALGHVGAQQAEGAAQFVKDTKTRPNPAGPNAPVTGINFMATNVPGPQTAWYLAGFEITDWVCAVPLAGNLGLGVVITSYNQQIFISLVAEPRLLPDIERMKSFVQEAFNELRQQLPQEVSRSRTDRSHAAAV